MGRGQVPLSLAIGRVLLSKTGLCNALFLNSHIFGKRRMHRTAIQMYAAAAAAALKALSALFVSVFDEPVFTCLKMDVLQLSDLMQPC